MATHHNSANLAACGVPAAAAAAQPRSRTQLLGRAPAAANTRGPRLAVRGHETLAPIYDFFNRRGRRLETRLTHRKQRTAPVSNQHITTFSRTPVMAGSHFPYPLASAATPSEPARAWAARTARPSGTPDSPASRSFRASYPFAQTPESYRPCLKTLLGWISIPRRSG